MKVTYANQGIKKLFYSEFLAVFAKAIMIILLRFVTKGRLPVGAFPYALLGLGIVIAGIRLPALRLAAYDEPTFQAAKKAGIADLSLCILNFVLFVPCRFRASVPVLAELLSSVLVTIFIVNGIVNLASALQDRTTAERGEKLKLLIFCLIISNALMMLLGPLLVLLLSTHVLPGSVITNYPLIYAPLFLALFVEWVLYLCYLKRAEKMMNKEIRNPENAVKVRPMS